mgnify:CR=1 FL=1
MISLIETIHQTENEVFVRAIVEDMIEVHPPTMEDPAEYGPAVCEATFELSEDDVLPEDEDELMSYLDSLDLDWNVLSKDWDY